MSKYVRGQSVFILPSDHTVQKAVVVEVNEHEYMLSLMRGGYITLPEERIFSQRIRTEERLMKIVKQLKDSL